jgi:hypothetical protein
MKNSLLLFICALAVLSSCKKGVQTCKLGKYYATDGSNSVVANTFFYDGSNRLIKIAYQNGTKDTLVYSADSIYVRSYDDRDSLTALLLGALNSNGYVTNAVKHTYDFLGNVTASDNYTLQYNADGTLSQQTIANTGGTETTIYEYTDGNRSSGKLFVGATETEKYIFSHSNAENKTGIDDNNGVYAPYFGKPSKNLLDSLQVFAGTDTTVAIYTHTLDRNDYVTKTIRTYLRPAIESRYYTYTYFDCGE